MDNKIKLWNHQIEAVRLMKASNNSGYALFMEAGTGKTACVIEYLRSISTPVIGGLQFPKTLIFCPLVVCQNWQNEFCKMVENVYRQTMVLTGSAIRKKGMLENRANIIITNYESLMQKDVVNALIKWCPEVLVCDESHRLKSPEARRSKEIMRLAVLAKKRFILSGTPVLKNELDLFQQFKVMDGSRGTTFVDKNFFSFRARYFENQNANVSHLNFPNWQIKSKSRDQITTIIFNKSFNVRKSECLDLPPLVKKTIPTPMSPEQSRAYNSMHKEFMAVVENKSGEKSVAIAELAITKALRLQQIVSGFVIDDQGKAIHFTKNLRIDALTDLLEDLPNKVIVWACFKENYKMIASVCDKLKKSYAFLTGEVSEKNKLKAIEDFTNGDTKVLISNQGAGIGINLVEASTAIYYSRDFSLEKDIQSEARNYRAGSEMHKKVTRIDLVTPETIDQQVVNALHEKQDVLDFVLNNIKKDKKCMKKVN